MRIDCLQTGPWLQLLRNRRLEWTRAVLPVADLPGALRGLRLLHLSDLHLHRRWDRSLDDLLRRVSQDPPDLICITGDFVEDKRTFVHALRLIERLLSGLQSRLGIFAILGNHDGDLLAPWLPRLGVTLLDHRRVVLRSEEAALELIGLGGVDRQDLDEGFIEDLPAKQPQVPRIVMDHFPDTLRRIDRLSADLYLTGHTHGGQVCLPGGLPIIRHDSLPRRLCTGIHRIGGRWLVVNRGAGFSGLPIRAFCPAEVIEIHLAPKEPRR